MTRNILIILLSILFLSSCKNQYPVDAKIETTATINYISLEGGFYGIVTEDGKHLDPINLKDEYKQNGLKVKLTYKERTDLASFHMWGRLIEIIEIRRIEG